MNAKTDGRVATRVARAAVTVLLAAGLASALGCVEGRTPSEKFHSRMRAKPAAVSDFLPDHHLLQKQPNTFPFHYFYLKENPPKVYARVHIAPVDTSMLRKSDGWAEFDRALAGKLGTEVDDLAVYMRDAYRQAFLKNNSSNRLEVVDRSDLPDTVVIEPAIIAIVPTKAELNAVGMAANFVVPGIGILTGALSGGSLTVECRIRDAETGEIISMYANTESEPRALLSTAQFTWTSSAKLNIMEIAANTAKVYYAARNYRQVNRRFPLRWTAFINDTKIDKAAKAK